VKIEDALKEAVREHGGRELIKSLYHSCDVAGSCMRNGKPSEYAEGVRSVGIMLFSILRKVDPTAWREVMIEIIDETAEAQIMEEKDE